MSFPRYPLISPAPASSIALAITWRLLFAAGHLPGIPRLPV
jgi:hypothetical protein